jgi:hypothetical protein
MTFEFFNDTGRVISIHSATEAHGTKGDMEPIQPMSIREFELPEGKTPWIKLWDYGEERGGLQLLVSSTTRT